MVTYRIFGSKTGWLVIAVEIRADPVRLWLEADGRPGKIDLRIRFAPSFAG